MKYILILVFTLLLLPVPAFAQAPNNIYGIHLAQPHTDDIKAASDLVNSNGGKWGYVTLVIQENDRDRNKWQGIFDQLRELHLIPIIRLATRAEGENWRRPEPEDAQSWVDFLNSLNWVTKNRYVILFNEPNHASEWGGEVDEKSYAKVAFEFAKRLKDKDKDFFVMLAGFDASAPSWPPGMEDEKVFLQRFFNENKLTPTPYSLNPSLFDYIDGWASHSYPNPGFAGPPYAVGRGTVRTYEWELDLLREMGVKKELPVFITETGWVRGDAISVAQNFRIAFDLWGRDPRVWAVTPFILNYQSPPFLEFSWKKPGEDGFWAQFEAIRSQIKQSGSPKQTQTGRLEINLPNELVAQSKYDFRLTLKNSGQAIWDKRDGYEIRVVKDDQNNTGILMGDILDIKPFQEKSVDFSLKTGQDPGEGKLKFNLVRQDELILGSKVWNFKILPLPSLEIEVDFFPFTEGKGSDFEIQIFDYEERLVFKKKGIKVEGGNGMVESIQNITLSDLYRVVILKPGYLPRQKYFVFRPSGNKIKYDKLLPFDFNRDGKFDWQDINRLFGR